MASERLHLLLLAAGKGRRFAAGDGGYSVPKQYIQIAGQTVLEHSLSAFKNSPLQSVVITLSPDDQYWPQLITSSAANLLTTEGGQTRAESVRLGLHALRQSGAAEDDWVLVHDAARCCVSETEIQTLIETCQSANQGGLLVSRINDTLKFSVNAQKVEKTINREHVYAALTPQMFRIGALLSALIAAAKQAITVTDESSAMEAMGQQPIMVLGKQSNIKLTRAEQMPQIEAYLTQQE